MLQENAVETSSSWLSTSDDQKNWNVCFSGSGSKGDDCLSIFRFQAREVDENLFGGMPSAWLASTVRKMTRVPLKTGSPIGTDK